MYPIGIFPRRRFGVTDVRSLTISLSLQMDGIEALQKFFPAEAAQFGSQAVDQTVQSVWISHSVILIVNTY